MQVSVVITAHNAADYLREAIQSVLSQTRQPDEIVVVDDGSTDHTSEVCASFGERVKYIYQNNDGTYGSTAHLRGILESSGELIAFMDHDDRWLPTKLEKQLQMFAQHPDAGAIFTGVQPINESGGQSDGFDTNAFLGGPSGEVFHELLKSCPYYASSALVPRSALSRVGLHDIDIIVGDWDQWLRIARHFPIWVVNESLMEYRTHASNFSGDRKRLAAGIRRVLERNRDRMHPDCHECRKAFRQGWAVASRLPAIKARQHLDRYHASALDGQLAAAFPFLWQALRTAPMEVLRPRRFLAVLRNAFRAKSKAMKNAREGTATR